MSDADRDQTKSLRALPAVDAVLRLLGPWPGAAAEVRRELEHWRTSLRQEGSAGPVPDAEALAARVRARLVERAARAHPRVVNATGVLLHTGLGRAPLAASAAAALGALAGAPQRVEVSAETGEREHREAAVGSLLCELTGAEAALVVNNNAAALVLVLGALARDKDVIVSRGELVEIGGGFRLPELLEQSGARLVEVGTTNRTYTSDVAAVLTWETGLVLRMHTSNYRIVGFTTAPPRGEVVALTREAGVPVMEDIGSGLLRPGSGLLEDEPDAASALAAGVDLVCFSGDKLLGGPQAGILLGRADLVARCRRHPLFRALRPDRLTLTALAATLELHALAPDEVPVLAALGRSPAERTERARSLAAGLTAAVAAHPMPAHGGEGSRPTFEVVSEEGSAGSGSAPARAVPSAAVELSWPEHDPLDLLRRLRTGSPPVFAKVRQGRVRFDVLALGPDDEALLASALRALIDGKEGTCS